MGHPLIIEPRYARNYSPKFEAQFGVAKQEPDGPREGLTKRFSKHTPTVPVPPP